MGLVSGNSRAVSAHPAVGSKQAGTSRGKDKKMSEEDNYGISAKIRSLNEEHRTNTGHNKVEAKEACKVEPEEASEAKPEEDRRFSEALEIVITRLCQKMYKDALAMKLFSDSPSIRANMALEEIWPEECALIKYSKDQT